MFRRLSELEGYAIGTADGHVGQVTDALFDDKAWVVRYLVVDIDSWLSSRKVLISPISVEAPTWSNQTPGFWRKSPRSPSPTVRSQDPEVRGRDAYDARP